MLDRLNGTLVRFLQLELCTAMTFLQVASRTSVPDHAARTREEARKAYYTVLNMANRVKMSDAEAVEIRTGLSELETAMRRAEEREDVFSQSPSVAFR